MSCHSPFMFSIWTDLSKSITIYVSGHFHCLYVTGNNLVDTYILPLKYNNVLVVSYYVSLRYEFRVVMSVMSSVLWCPLWVPCCDVRYEFRVVMSVMSSVLWCPLRFPHKNYVRFVFISGYLWEGSCLVYVICICLRVVVSNTCVFLGFSFFVLCGQFLWIVLFLLPLRCSLT
jgi:hypothetical protein